ncbi:hypothetical protein [Massilia scottii]|uniref:hypothetical protein n=1 Tax=Massilia scottii TaxID=3057166 RepID=UPI002796D258|nr:hypothetical protein [Massilia sp. CCM 9029]MDQ1830399.1 hypothetical protein [Massilia sp. CCM 9029]
MLFAVTWFRNGRWKRVPAVLPSLVFSLPLWAAAADRASSPPVPAVAAVVADKNSSVHIDGFLNEAIWARAPVHDQFFEYQPQDGNVAPDHLRTAYQIVVDDEAIIFAIRAWNNHPGQLRGMLSRRDKVDNDQDFIGIFIDPTGHGNSAQFVRVNTAGIVTDGLYRAADDELDLGPDFPVTASVKVLSDGYSMEVRWPLSNLRFPYADGKKWRIMVERSVPHAGGKLLLSAPLRKNSLSYIAEMQEITGIATTVDAVRDRGFIATIPEYTVRKQREEVDGRSTRSVATAMGLEINARPRADWVLNATLNPDFSQVEIDEPSAAGGSAIALSLPEKRGFFLESLDVVGMPLAAFYSRTAADPAWGARATWRGSSADATGLMLKDQPGGLVLRGSPYGTEEVVQRQSSSMSLARLRWHGGDWLHGAFVSGRDAGDAGKGHVLGVDGQWTGRTLGSGQSQASWLVMHSRSSAGFLDAHPAAVAPRQGWYALGKLAHRSEDWANEMRIETISPGFVNDNGFVPQTGVRKSHIDINRRAGPVSIGAGASAIELYEFEFHLGLRETRTLGDLRTNQAADEIVQRELQPGIWLFGPRQTRLWANAGFDQQRAKPLGRLHRTPALHFGGESSPFSWLPQVVGELTLGKRLDIDADRVGSGGAGELGIRWNWALPYRTTFESEHRWTRTWVRGTDGTAAVVDNGWRWLGMLHLSASDSIRVLAQDTFSGRRADDLARLDVWSQRQRHRSMLYRHVWRHERSVSAGLSRDTSNDPSVQTTSLVLKMQWGL